MVPELIGKLTGLGAEVLVEPDAGRGAQISDEEFTCLLYTSPSPRDS